MGPPGGGHHEKKKKGEADFAGASDRVIGHQYDIQFCRIGQPQPHGAANGEKGTRCRTRDDHARGRYGRIETPRPRRFQCLSRSASEFQKGSGPRGNGEEGMHLKTMEKVSRERDEIVFLPSPVLYRLAAGYDSRYQKNGARILIPKGTLVRVAGITLDDKALVVSRKGNPDGLIARSSLEEIPDEQANTCVHPLRFRKRR